MKWSASNMVVDGIRLQGAEARQVSREAARLIKHHRTNRDRWVQLAMIASLSLLLIGIMTPTMWIRANWGFAASFGIQAIAGGAIGLLYGMWWQRKYRREFRQAMRVLGYDLCESCGYWLHGLPEVTIAMPGVRRGATCGARA